MSSAQPKDAEGFSSEDDVCSAIPGKARTLRVCAQPKPGTCHSAAIFAAVLLNECFDSSWAVVPDAILLKQQR